MHYLVSSANDTVILLYILQSNDDFVCKTGNDTGINTVLVAVIDEDVDWEVFCCKL